MTSPKKDAFQLIVRLIVGGIFITTGWIKVSAMTVTLGYFASMNLPAFIAYIVSYAELIGGVLIVIGLWECLAAFVLSVIMVFAIWYSRSFGIQGTMPPLAMLASLLSIIHSGGGKYVLRQKPESHI